MTSKEITEIAKKKLGKVITEQEAIDYLNGKLALPDEAIELVSGGGECVQKCPKCGETLEYREKFDEVECFSCGYIGPAVRTFN